MDSLPRGPGGETRSPAKLGRDTAALLLNSVRRERDNFDLDDRPVHRPGAVAEGRFVASGDLAPYCRTPALSAGQSHATVRFSSFGDADWQWSQDIRGMACRLVADERPGQDPDTVGRHLDLVAVSAPRFHVRREVDFIEAPKAGRRLTWVLWAVLRRTTFTALVTMVRFRTSGPLSRRNRHLAFEHYFGLHTFWIDKAGRERAMRYHWRPIEPADPRIDDHVAGLRQQARPDSPVTFQLIVDLLDDDVPYRMLHDPVRRWPGWLRERKPFRSRSRWRGTTRVVAGTLELTAAPVDPQHPALTRWVFNPVPEIGGFKASDDEILQARGSAYVASHVERLS